MIITKFSDGKYYFNNTQISESFFVKGLIRQLKPWQGIFIGNEEPGLKRTGRGPRHGGGRVPVPGTELKGGL